MKTKLGWEERFDTEFLFLEITDGEGHSFDARDNVKSFIHQLIRQERQSLLKEVGESILAEKKEVKLEGEEYNVLDADPACVHGWNSALDLILEILRDKMK